MREFGEYVAIYLFAFMLSVFLVPVVRRFALRLGAVDLPDRVRKIHKEAIPRMGGVAIFVAFIVPVVGAWVLGATGLVPGEIYDAFKEKQNQLIGLLSASLLVLLLGVYDDIYHVRPRTKVVVQVIAGLILCYAGTRITEVGIPFMGERLVFPVWVSWSVTVFWVLAITNAINLIDGMDGLGPGVGLFVALTFGIISVFSGVPMVTAMTATLVGAIIGFLIFNFHPAKVFMGDSGSLFVGFVLAALSVQGTMKRHIMIPMVALAIPIVDTLMAILRRWSRGLPMSVPDRLHVHHRLIKMGFSQMEAVLLLYGICIILGCAALVMTMAEGAWFVVMASVTIVAVLGAGVAMLGGKELAAVPSLIATAVRRRRRRGKAWVKVYNTVAKLENAKDLDQMWSDLGGVLEELEIDAAEVHLDVSIAGVRDFKWSRTDAEVETDPDGVLSEGWTARLALESDGRRLGRLVLGKDTRMEPLPDGLAEMIEVLRWEMLKAIQRLESAGAAEVGTDTHTGEARPVEGGV